MNRFLRYIGLATRSSFDKAMRRAQKAEAYAHLVTAEAEGNGNIIVAGDYARISNCHLENGRSILIPPGVQGAQISQCILRGPDTFENVSQQVVTGNTFTPGGHWGVYFRNGDESDADSFAELAEKQRIAKEQFDALSPADRAEYYSLAMRKYASKGWSLFSQEGKDSCALLEFIDVNPPATDGGQHG